MPVNISGIHWVLLAAHMPSRTISIVDSLSMASGPSCVTKWRYRNVLIIKINAITNVMIALVSGHTDYTFMFIFNTMLNT